MWHAKRFMEITIGSRESITRGMYSGLFSAFPVTLLVVVYFALVQEIELPEISLQGLDFWDTFGRWFPVACVYVLFVVMGGRGIGWLLTRPIAGVLSKVFSASERSSNWALGSAVVWAALALLVTRPLQHQVGIPNWLSFAAILILSLVFGALGGRLGARAPTGLRDDYRELLGTGGSVTGTLLAVILTLPTVIPSIKTPLSGLSTFAPFFCIALVILSFLCAFPYLIIAPLAAALSRIGSSQRRSLLIHTMTSGICWTLLAVSLVGIFTDDVDLGQLGLIVLLGMCGACGGWAVGQLRQGKVHSGRLRHS